MDFGSFRLSENKLKLFDEASASEVCYRLVFPADLQLKASGRYVSAPHAAKSPPDVIAGRRRRRGRPRKGESRQTMVSKAAEADVVEVANDETSPLARTRYGRVTRPPKHMSKFIDIEETADAAKDPSNQMVNELPDFDPGSFERNASNEEVKKGRKNLAQITCHFCKKVRLRLHLESAQRSMFLFADLLGAKADPEALECLPEPQNGSGHRPERTERFCGLEERAFQRVDFPAGSGEGKPSSGAFPH